MCVCKKRAREQRGGREREEERPLSFSAKPLPFLKSSSEKWVDVWRRRYGRTLEVGEGVWGGREREEGGSRWRLAKWPTRRSRERMFWIKLARWMAQYGINSLRHWQLC